MATMRPSLKSKLHTTVEIHPHISSDKEWPLIKKYNALQPLSYDEIDALMKLHEQEIIIDAHRTFLHQKSIRQKCFIVNSGCACRYIELTQKFGAYLFTARQNSGMK